MSVDALVDKFVEIYLKDGSTKYGKVVSVNPEHIILLFSDGRTVPVLTEFVKEVRAIT